MRIEIGAGAHPAAGYVAVDVNPRAAKLMFDLGRVDRNSVETQQQR